MNSLKLALPFALAALIAACGGSSGTPTGTMQLSLTDSPACGYDNVFVTVEKVRVHQSSSANDNDSGWSEVVLPTPQRVDLLTLTNGTLLPLGATELPAGTYTQMRLVLGTTPPPGSPQGMLANSIKPTGSAETELTTPSGQQSGLKMNVNITVPAGQVADFAIDFDACKSFVKSGNSGKYILKPVLTVTPIVSSAAQRVVGYVDPALAAGGTSISLQQGGVAIKGTVPGTNGSFVLYPVPAGTYDLVVTSAGRATAVMTGVPVTTTTVTTINALATPIAPPALTQGTRDVTGTVSPAAATVRALQALNGGPTVETHWAAVDATSGDFTFTLPIDPPVRTAYAVNPPTMTLAPDTLALGLYTIEARSGNDTKTQAIDTKAAVPPVTLAFP
ncbi:MAG TPA: DUF4382 domain-containing protein [Burkholderiaceae bacterium]|nr:DUF4382 domain-containing protein [Burkholderiaceae bacterium]